MKIRFQADNDFNELVVDALLLVNPEIDFQTAPKVGLHLGVPDDQVLRIAAGQKRIVVSHDFKTMPYHFADFISRQSSPGLILLSQKLPIRRARDELLLIWEASEAEEYIDKIYRIT